MNERRNEGKKERRKERRKEGKRGGKKKDRYGERGKKELPPSQNLGVWRFELGTLEVRN
jgi:hypothetical protein